MAPKSRTSIDTTSDPRGLSVFGTAQFDITKYDAEARTYCVDEQELTNARNDASESI
jgi:hypothetical protein